MTRALFLTTHLSGSGHLTRTLALARAVEAAGGAARVLSGGRPLAHLPSDAPLTQLPPVAVPGLDFTRLLDPDGRPADAARMAARAGAIADAIETFAPTVLVTELFPFGRRLLAAEFEAAAALARARGAGVLCSVRDVPEPPRKPGRAAEAAERLRRLYDGVLVHGDPAVLPFAGVWPEAEAIADLLTHTGYVAEPPPPPEGDPEEVLVAVGGGALGRDVLSVAVDAARLGERPWRLRVGGADAEAVVDRLAAEARGAPVTVEPAAPDYRARLGACAVSVSLFGYNTAVDLAQGRAPAVVVPSQAGGEREQTIRARAFAAICDRFEVIEPPALTPDALAAAVARAAARGPGAAPRIDLGGAARAARIMRG